MVITLKFIYLYFISLYFNDTYQNLLLISRKKKFSKTIIK